MDQQSKEDDLGPKSIGVRLTGEKKVMVPGLSSIVSGQAVSKTLTHIPLTM